MNAAFKHFMQEIIDYAGLFPPARLDLETALSQYQTYQQNSENWILSKFVIPEATLKSISQPGEMKFSVILSEPDSNQFLSSLRTLAPNIVSFEIRLPEDCSAIEHISSFLGRTIRKVEAAGIEKTSIFVESARVDLCDADILGINKFKRHTCHNIGYKLRCGGTVPGMVPDPDQVLIAIRSCISRDLSMKFTAGLHHPFSDYSQTLEGLQYGFINVFTASLLGFSSQLSDKEIKACLMDQKMNNFDFDDTKLSWNGHSIPSDRIKQLRGEKITSFGSCSFEEPLNDLKSLSFLF
ncbi:MAG: hypothetical protein MI892_30650 [Desulfobacterales bacterium]|nr:hypothetical protein [Desulfobacterales bacterium]